MARKRMFDSEVIDTDLFLDMPQSTRLLYYDLGMRADDDGFVSNPKKIIRTTGANEDDLKLLIMKSFIIGFENGIIVIRHWRLNNYIQKDRYHETIYKEEKKQLTLDNNNVYNLYTSCIPSIDKNRLDKISIDKNSIKNNTPEKSGENKYEEELLKIEFDKLWKLYPKKVGKEKSFTKYVKYRTSKGSDYVTFDEVLNGLNKYLIYIEQNKWYSPKDALTWFNNKSWNDEYVIEDAPGWVDKEVKEEKMTNEEIEELKDMMQGF